MNFKKILYTITLVLITISTYAQVPVVEWSMSIGGTSYDNASSYVIDNDGNMIIVGNFNGTVDFDPSSSVFNISTNTSSTYILKLDSIGNFIWAKAFLAQPSGTSTVSNVYGEKVEVDFNNDIIVMGTIIKKVDFDPGSGTHIINAFDRGFYVAKLSGTGNFMWAGYADSPDPVSATAMAVDPSGNIFIGGESSYSMDYIFGTSQNLTGFASFMLKISSYGNSVWIKQLLGGSLSKISDIHIHSSGDIFYTGYYSGTIDFDMGSGIENRTAIGARDFYVSRITSSGGYLWVKNSGGTGMTVSSGISLDTDDNIILSGEFSGTTDFNPGTDTFNLTSQGAVDAFVLKLTPTGTFAWANKIGGLDDDVVKDIATDNNNNIYVTGIFKGICNFDFSSNNYSLTSEGDSDGFIEALSPLGSVEWLEQVGGAGFDGSNSIFVDYSESVYVSGYFSNATTGNINLTSNGLNDGFALKIATHPVPVSLSWNSLEGPSGNNYTYQWLDCNNNYSFISGETDRKFYPTTSGSYSLKLSYGNSFNYSTCTNITINGVNNIDQENITLYPNPVINTLIIELGNSKNSRVEILDFIGNTVVNINTLVSVNSIDVSTLSSGVYFVKITTKHGISFRTFVKK